MKIGVVAPANPIDPAVVAKAQAFVALAFPDVDLVIHPQVYRTDGGHFAGPDDVRAAALLEMANDPAFDAIWFARGGYGSNRLFTRVLPHLNDAARVKSYVGYSDMTFLLSALYAARIGQPASGPMLADINRKDGDQTVTRTLQWLTRRDTRGLEPGLAGRPSAAFNLSILHALIGTPYLPDLADHVLIIEEVSEPLYAIDRMLFHLAHATQLKGIVGVRLGYVTAIKPNEPGWQGSLDDMMQRWCTEMGVPYLGRAEVGHVQQNHVVPFGWH